MSAPGSCRAGPDSGFHGSWSAPEAAPRRQRPGREHLCRESGGDADRGVSGEGSGASGGRGRAGPGDARHVHAVSAVHLSPKTAGWAPKPRRSPHERPGLPRPHPGTRLPSVRPVPRAPTRNAAPAHRAGGARPPARRGESSPVRPGVAEASSRRGLARAMPPLCRWGHRGPPGEELAPGLGTGPAGPAAGEPPGVRPAQPVPPSRKRRGSPAWRSSGCGEFPGVTGHAGARRGAPPSGGAPYRPGVLLGPPPAPGTRQAPLGARLQPPL